MNCNILEVILTKLRHIVIFTYGKLVFCLSGDPLCVPICCFSLISQLFEVRSENKLHHCTRERFCNRLSIISTRFDQFWKFSLFSGHLEFWKKIFKIIFEIFWIFMKNLCGYHPWRLQLLAILFWIHMRMPLD